MKLFLEKAIFVNRAPFDKLELDFDPDEIAVLSGVNGRGKTTILSHIVDAFHEMARPHFHNEFEDKLNKFYRVSSVIYSLNPALPSFAYLRFRTASESFDYLDMRNICDESQYNEAVSIEDKIPFSQFQQELQQQKYVRRISSNFNAAQAEAVFSNNLLTYFPSYRYEQPGYLNDPYKVKLNFKKESGFSGFLKNPIEVVTGLPQLANWMLDIILDLYVHGNQESTILINNLTDILTKTLLSKQHGSLRFGIGPRNFGATRIQIINAETNVQVYPTIFNLSAGECALLCLFGELIRQADNCKNDIQLSDISGIVLIDEIDKHLHIKLQKEVVSKLLGLFPNTQFITSSHSPFLGMGLAEDANERAKIVDLDNLGISKDPTINQLYIEVYNMMIDENQRFKENYQLLKQKLEKGNAPLIVTEGKTDIQHIKKAQQRLDINDIELEYFELPEQGWGSSKLKLLLENLCNIKNTRKVIGIFDRDEGKIISDIEKSSCLFKRYGNNVFAFCIPVPPGREQNTNISIEFYYADSEIKKEKDGKRLYFDNELNFDSKRTPRSPILEPEDSLEKKIWCENIGGTDWIHSKARFAELVENDADFTSDFNFDNFNLIFKVIREIIASET